MSSCGKPDNIMVIRLQAQSSFYLPRLLFSGRDLGVEACGLRLKVWGQRFGGEKWEWKVVLRDCCEGAAIFRDTAIVFTGY